jgi:hypothetical protein
MYTNSTPITFNILDAAAVSTCYSALPLASGKEDCRPRCHDLPASCRSSFTFLLDSVGAAAPVLTLSNVHDDWVLPLRVICYADPGSVGPDNPCGLRVLGEVYIAPMPPHSELRWDVARREVEYVDAATGDWVSGYGFVDANDPPYQRFFTLPCHTAHIVVEPANWCIDVSGSNYVYGDITVPTANVHFPGLTLEILERTGCA